MKKQALIYSGKAKSVYATDDDQYVIIEFRDDATAFNGVKKAKLDHKGVVNNYFNAFIMEHLQKEGIATHFVKMYSECESVFKRLEMIPVECVTRNITAGGLSKRLGIDEGLPLNPAVFEFFYKSDPLNDPMINESIIRTFQWADDKEIEVMKTKTLQVNDILTALFQKAGLLLVDFKLEFGRFQGDLLLGDEFTPDGCRVWDAKTREKLDKDRFRRDLGNVIESYEKIAQRLGITLPKSVTI